MSSSVRLTFDAAVCWEWSANGAMNVDCVKRKSIVRDGRSFRVSFCCVHFMHRKDVDSEHQCVALMVEYFRRHNEMDIPKVV